MMRRLLPIGLSLGLLALSAQAGTVSLYLSQPGNSASNTFVPQAVMPELASNYRTVVERFNGHSLVNGQFTLPQSGTWAIGSFVAGSGATLSVNDQYGGGDPEARDAPNGSTQGLPENAAYLRPGANGVTITLNEPARYVGFWWSAGDNSNFLDIYDAQDNLLGTISTQTLGTFLGPKSPAKTLTALNLQTYQNTQYYGNPMPHYRNSNGNLTNNTDEPYAYVNLVVEDDSAAAIGKLVLRGGNFEADNVAVGFAQVVAADIPQTWVPVTPSLTIADAPVTQDDLQIISKNSSAIIPFASNDALPSGTTVTVTETNATAPTATERFVTVGEDGTLNYTPPVNFTGLDSFDYEACVTTTVNTYNSSGQAESRQETLCSTSTVTVLVTEPQPPAAPQGESQTIANLGPLPDGASLTPKNNDPAKGEFTVAADGTVTFEPAPGFAGRDTVTLEACLDGRCTTSEITVSVTPAAPPQFEATPINTVLTRDASTAAVAKLPTLPPQQSYSYGAIDPSTSQPGTAEITTANNGTVTMQANGQYIYTPANGFEGRDTFEYQVCMPSPNQDLCGVETIEVIVSGHPAAMTPATGNTIVPPQGYTVGPQEPSTDVPGSQAQVDENGNIIYTPPANYFGEDTISYEICNAQSICTPAQMTVIVPPQANDGDYSFVTGGSVDGEMSSPNALPNDAYYEIVTEPDSGTVTFTAATGEFTYTHTGSGSDTTDSFTYRVCVPAANAGDAPLCSAAATMTLNGAAPAAFEVPPQLEATTTDEPITRNASTLAAPGLPALPGAGSYSYTTPNANSTNGGTVNMQADGSYTYTPAAGYTGVDTFTYSTCMPAPNEAVCASESVTIIVTGAEVTTSAGGTVTPLLPQGGTLDPNPANAPTSAQNGTVTIGNGGELEYVPAPGFVGADTVTYGACDANGQCTTAQMRIWVPPLVPAPQSNTYPIGGERNGQLEMPSNYPADAYFAIVTRPVNGTLVDTPEGAFTYTHDGSQTFSDEFTFMICLPVPNGLPVCSDAATYSLSASRTGVITSAVPVPGLNAGMTALLALIMSAAMWMRRRRG